MWNKIRILSHTKPHSFSFFFLSHTAWSYNFSSLFHSKISLFLLFYLHHADSELEELETTPRYRPDSLSALSRSTRFSEAEIKRIYRGFKAECPSGVVKEETFKIIYSQFFPQGGLYAYFQFDHNISNGGSYKIRHYIYHANKFSTASSRLFFFVVVIVDVSQLSPPYYGVNIGN